MRYALTVGILWLAVLVAPGRSDDQTSSAATATLAEELDTIREKHDVPALGVAWVVDGELVDSAAVGVRRHGHDEPVDIDDAWHIGSNTKAMTATLVARLVEQDVLDWDTTIADALPEMVQDDAQPFADVTIRQLLAHRGGIVGGDANQELLPILWQLNLSGGDIRDHRRKAVPTILEASDADSIGKFEYSNFGYVIAAAMIEQLTDETYESLMREHVFEPLGMSSAGFGPPDGISGHRRVGEKWQSLRLDNPPVLTPAGRAHMTLADWAKYAAAQLGHVEGFLSDASLEILHTPYPADDGSRYALGWGVHPRSGLGAVLMHDGSNTMWYARIFVSLEKDAAFLAACNAPSREACEDAVDAAIEMFKGENSE